ncbi:MAG: thermonuclease family protein [Nanoarchaeota archaeon]
MKKEKISKPGIFQNQTFRILLYILIVTTFLLVGYLFPNPTGKSVYTEEIANVTRVVDGDTIETDLGKVRLLGVNTPEKNQYYYEEAKNFLASLEGKQIKLEIQGKDLFQRILAYVIYDDRLIEEEILENGYGNYFTYNEDKYTSRLKSAEKKAINKQIGVWELSQDECARCIILMELNKEEPGEYIILKNNCGFDCSLYSWTIKDDVTHITDLNFIVNAGHQKTINFEGAIWNDDHDTFFLRDDAGRLVLWYRY